MKKESQEIDFTNGNGAKLLQKQKSNKYILWMLIQLGAPCKLLKSKTFKEKRSSSVF